MRYLTIILLLFFISCSKPEYEYGKLTFVTTKHVPAKVSAGINNKLGWIQHDTIFSCEDDSAFTYEFIADHSYQIIINNGVDTTFDKYIYVPVNGCRVIRY
jgi:hypothetical protein